MSRIALFVLALAAVACAGDPYRMPIPQGYDPAKFHELGYSEAYANGRVFLYFPIGMNDTIERATKLAIERNGGDAITDVIVTQRYSLSPITYGVGVRVRGLVLRRISPDKPETDYERGRREERERIERERGGR